MAPSWSNFQGVWWAGFGFAPEPNLAADSEFFCLSSPETCTPGPVLWKLWSQRELCSSELQGFSFQMNSYKQINHTDDSCVLSRRAPSAPSRKSKEGKSSWRVFDVISYCLFNFPKSARGPFLSSLQSRPGKARKTSLKAQGNARRKSDCRVLPAPKTKTKPTPTWA